MRYPGGIIRGEPVTPTTASAPGVWTLASALQAQAQGLWPVARIGAIRMLANEDDGLALDFTDTTNATGSAAVKDTGTPANDFDGAPQDLLTYSGSSAKWVWNDSGVLVESAAGALPIDHDPVTDARKGLLVEEQRTNIILHSADFSNAYWTKHNLTVASEANGKFGTVTELTADAGTHDYVRVFRSASVWIGTDDRLLFAALKMGTWRYASLTTRSWVNSNEVIFDLQEGVVSGTGSSTPATDYGMNDLGDGWYLCWMHTAPHTGTVRSPGVHLSATASAAYGGTWAGTETIYCAFMQGEVAKFPTSYIPTTTATVTRAADAPQEETTDLSWSDTAGTVYVQGRTAMASGTQIIWQADDGTANERIRIERNSSNEIHCIVTDGGTDQCDINLGAVADETEFEVRFAWAANDFAASLDGRTVVTDSAGTLPTVTAVRFGHSQAGEQQNEVAARTAWVPRRVTDGDLPTWQAA